MKHSTEEYSELLDGRLPTSTLEFELCDRLIELQEQVKNCSIPNVGKRIYLTFAYYNCDSTYNTLEKANQRVKQIKDQNPDMEGVYIISREVE